MPNCIIYRSSTHNYIATFQHNRGVVYTCLIVLVDMRIAIIWLMPTMMWIVTILSMCITILATVVIVPMYCRHHRPHTSSDVHAIVEDVDIVRGV